MGGRGKPFLLSGHPTPWYRMLWEEFLVAAFEDIHLGVVQAGVVVSCTVPFPDKPAPRAAWEGVQGRTHVRKRPTPLHAALRVSKGTGSEHRNVIY